MNASAARTKLDALLNQREEMEAFVVAADRFTRESIAGGVESLFIDGPFQGKTWIDVYKEMLAKRTLIGKMRYTITQAEFETVCLEAIEATGKCYLSIRGRDCDCSSFGYATSFDTLEEADSYREMMYESADGPIGVAAITKEDFDAVESYSHDLALAAHEDGHPYSVSEADWTDRG